MLSQFQFETNYLLNKNNQLSQENANLRIQINCLCTEINDLKEKIKYIESSQNHLNTRKKYFEMERAQAHVIRGRIKNEMNMLNQKIQKTGLKISKMILAVTDEESELRIIERIIEPA